MAATTALLALGALSAANTVSNYSQQRRAATAAQQQGDYEAQLFGMNAEIADRQAEDAIARGREVEGRVRAGSRKLVGSQRAALAASGVDLDFGSARDVVDEDVRISELDALTVRNNAAREAYGFRAQAAIGRAQGELARTGGRNTAKALRNQSVGTLLSGAAELYDVYNSFGRTRSPSKPKPAPDYGGGAYPGGMLG